MVTLIVNNLFLTPFISTLICVFYLFQAMWIESLNTVMDDNRVLTLASNERIALTPTMRLLFEISNLRTATPATVSRAGILYINPQDLGWNPYVTSWIETRTVPAEKSNLVILFDKYTPACLENVRSRFKKITPIVEMAHIQLLCHLLECLLVIVSKQLTSYLIGSYLIITLCSLIRQLIVLKIGTKSILYLPAFGHLDQLCFKIKQSIIV